MFDAYGTLFDIHSAAEKCRDQLGDKADRLSAVWRQKQLEYSWLRSLTGDYKSFWEITKDGLDYALDAVAIHNPDLREKLLGRYWQLDAYPEVPQMLMKLREGGIKTVILSNGSHDMLNAAVASAGVQDLLDDMQSAADVGIFKPHPSVYQMTLERLKIQPAEICFMSANGWDVHGAAFFGFRAVWINRFQQPPEKLSGAPEKILPDLSPLPGLLGI